VSVVEHPPPPPPPAGRRCPRCGAGLTERQEWCLHCGAAVGTRVVAAPGWRTPIVLTGLLLAVTAVALTLTIVTLADDTTTQVAQAPPAAAPATPTPTPDSATATPDPAAIATPDPAATATPDPAAIATPDPAATATPDPAATATPDPAATATPDPVATATRTPEPTSTPDATPGSGSGAVESWPQGESGWTVVLASERSRARARTKAENFAANGTSGVGILDSDDFSSLTGGYWVVYAGRYTTRRAAENALEGIDTPDAYVRQVTPR
jgi:hypothetical protein